MTGGLAAGRLITSRGNGAPKSFNEGFASGIQFLLQTAGAIAIAASPRFGAILVAAAATVMCVLHTGEIEILLPVWTFFLKRRGTIADFDPSCGFVWAEAGIFHIPEVFAFGNRAFTQGLIVDGFQ